MKIIKNIFLAILFELTSFLNVYSMEQNTWKHYAQTVQAQESKISQENFLSAALGKNKQIH